MAVTAVPVGTAEPDGPARPNPGREAPPGTGPAGHPGGPGPASTTEVVVLDTSVLVSDPAVAHGLGTASLVVPLTVVEELDGLKGRPDDVGHSARTALRTVEELRVANGGDLRNPAPLPAGGTLRVVDAPTSGRLAEVGLDATSPDNRILAAAAQLADGTGPVRVLTNDAALRIKAAQLGLAASEYQRPAATLPVGPTGWSTIEVAGATVDAVYAGTAELAALDAADRERCERLGPNEFAALRAGSQSALVRRTPTALRALGPEPRPWGLSARSKEQRFALELLLDPDVKVVALDGHAGTGKTILAMAAGLEQVVESPARYGRLAVYRPIVPVGRTDLGYLPGDLDEKLHPWMAAVTDAVVGLTEEQRHDDARAVVDELVVRQKLTLEAVTFLRGRTLHRTFVLVDEAQNLEPATLKTILTRVGERTKVVLTGDTSQIDQPYLSEQNNAVAVLVSTFAGEACFGHVRLTRGERSEVAELAASRL